AAFGVRHRESLAALTAYLLAAYLLTARLWSDPAGLQIARNPDDTNLYQWWFGWWLHALSTWQDPFISYAMNMPTGVSLMANTSMPLPAFATSWLDALAGPLVVYNLLSTLAPALSAWAGFVCARRFGVRPPVAFVGGLVFGFSAAIVYSMLGHLSMALAPLLPILVLLNVLAWRTRRPRRVGLALGGAALAQVFTGEEVLFQAGLATLIVLIVAVASRPHLVRSALPVAARSYAWALGLFLPIAAYPLYIQFFGPLKATGSPFWVDYFAADLAAFTTASELNWRGPGAGAEKFPGGITEHLAYLGWPLVIFCLVTIVARWGDLRVRAAGVGLVVAGVFSMGGTLWVRGHQTEQTLPWGWFKELPVLESALPSRFGLLTALFAAAVLVFGLQALVEHPNRVPMRLVAVGAVAALCWTLPPQQLPVEPVADIPAYFTTEARRLPEGTKALVVPFPRPHQTEPLRWQRAAEYSYDAPGGYFIAPAWDGHPYIGGVAGPLQKLLVAAEEKGAVPMVTPELRAATRAELDEWGIDIAILGPSDRPEQLRALLTELFEQEPRAVGGVLVWDLV
ncbi:MAG TPA: hypothetical protein VFO77_12865, partial [Actinoplanes sp.]|nr:hypothetical protein [Actinoplanes sp.]